MKRFLTCFRSIIALILVLCLTIPLVGAEEAYDPSEEYCEPQNIYSWGDSYYVSTEGASELEWVNAYDNFITEFKFLYADDGRSMVNDYYEEPVTPDNILSMDSCRPIEISLYDFDWNGIPELLIDIGGDCDEGKILVYKYRDSCVCYLGWMYYYKQKNFGYYCTDQHTGLVEPTEIRGTIEYEYYYLSGDEIISESIYDETIFDSMESDEDPEEPIVDRITENDSLFSTALLKDRLPVLFYPLKDAINGHFFTRIVRPVMEQTAYDIIQHAVGENAVEGYAYAQGLPDNWVWIQQWISLTQLNISGMDVYTARKQLYFDFALKACSNTSMTPYMNVNLITDDIKTLKKFSDFGEDFFYDELRKITPEGVVVSWEGPQGSAIRNVVNKYIDSDMSDLDLDKELAKLGMTSLRQRQPIFKNMRSLKILRTYGQAMDVYGKAEKLVNNVVDVVNKWNLLDSVDQDQLMEIANSYVSRGDPEMRQVGYDLLQYLNSSRMDQLALLAKDQFVSYGFNLLYSKFESEIFKSIGGVRGVVWTIVFMTIDKIMNLEDTTECNVELVAAAENMHHFHNEYNNDVGYYELYKKDKLNSHDEQFIRMVYAYLNYYAAAIMTEERFQDLVEAGDQAILRNILNNEAMRVSANKAMGNVNTYKKFQRHVREMLDIYNARLSDEYLTGSSNTSRLVNAAESETITDIETPAPETADVGNTGASRYPCKAFTVKTKVNLRAEMDKDSKRIAQFSKARTEVTVLSEAYDKEGVLWYYVRTSKGNEGYIRYDFLNLE